MAKNRKMTKAYRQLRAGLLDSLEARGMVEPVYLDMLEHYLHLWEQFQDLQDDIAARGVTVFDEKRGMLIENRSVVLEMQVSRQMLAIYTTLGFKELSMAPASAPPAEEDDEL